MFSCLRARRGSGLRSISWKNGASSQIVFCNTAAAISECSLALSTRTKAWLICHKLSPRAWLFTSVSTSNAANEASDAASWRTMSLSK